MSAGDPHHNFLRSRAVAEDPRSVPWRTILSASTAPYSDAPRRQRRPIISCASSTTITLSARRGKACRRSAPAPRAQEQMGARISSAGAVPRHRSRRLSHRAQARLRRDARAPRILDGASGLSATLRPHRFDEGAQCLFRRCCVRCCSTGPVAARRTTILCDTVVRPLSAPHGAGIAPS